MRESIGLTLSVLCSNIRLNELCNQVQSHETQIGDPHKNMETGRWDQYLIDRASELVLNIQKSSQSDGADNSTDKVSENGTSNDQSKDDAKWMETV